MISVWMRVILEGLLTPPPTETREKDGLPDAPAAELLIVVAGPECRYLRSGKTLNRRQHLDTD